MQLLERCDSQQLAPTRRISFNFGSPRPRLEPPEPLEEVKALVEDVDVDSVSED